MCSRVPFDLSFDPELQKLMSDRHRDFLEDIDSEHERVDTGADTSSHSDTDSDGGSTGSGSDSDVVESSSQDLVSQFGNTTENDRETGSNRESEVTEEFEGGCGCNNRCYSKISADHV